MRYLIKVDGGFTGIPRTFEGDVTLSEQKKRALLQAMGTPEKPSENLRDGRNYSVQLCDGGQTMTASFDDTNLPLEIRELLQRKG